ncbi:MAG: hypothetical protein OXC46_12280, partial [Thaumarchaeota archaeon]|nr:hypothetical protein [Nitrososphaerota archaeon]
MYDNHPPPNTWVIWLATVIAISSLSISFNDSFAQTNVDLTPTDNIDDSGDTDYELDGANGITSFVINGKTYVAVTGNEDGGVQILDVSDPGNITATDSFNDGSDNNILLEEAAGITSFVISGNTYVAVAGSEESGVQIINVTDPANITAVTSITDTVAREFEGASGITSFVINGNTYVGVTGYNDDGVQIIDVTDLSKISYPDLVNNTSSLELDGAQGITSFVIETKTYVGVTGNEDDGVQILDVSDPGELTATDSIDDMDGTLELDGASGITSFVIGNKTHLAVAGEIDDGVQILEISSQGNITARDSIDNDSTLKLDGASGIT